MDEQFIDLTIFNKILKKRPEISAERLKEDLQKFYLPYANKLIALHKNMGEKKALIVGVSAIQGTGKTTQGEILETLLGSLGYTSISRSIDDHYITHEQLCNLRNQDSRFIRRGVTHDINLAISDLRALQQKEDGLPILVSGYDKGLHQGDGDRLCWINGEPGVVITAKVLEKELRVNKQIQTVRALQLTSFSFHGNHIPLPENMGSDIPVYGHFLPDDLNGFLEANQEKDITISFSDSTAYFKSEQEIAVPLKSLPNGWRLVHQRPHFIFYDGWMVGVRKVQDESVFSTGLPALETEEAQQFARYVNQKLDQYLPLWELFEYLTVLYVPNYQDSIAWRDQAEDVLRLKGKGMTHEQIREFVYYFWRSVHPAIHIKNLASDLTHTNQVVVINDDHTVKEVLTPEEVRTKYP